MIKAVNWQNRLPHCHIASLPRCLIGQVSLRHRPRQVPLPRVRQGGDEAEPQDAHHHGARREEGQVRRVRRVRPRPGQAQVQEGEGGEAERGEGKLWRGWQGDDCRQVQDCLKMSWRHVVQIFDWDVMCSQTFGWDVKVISCLVNL